jgi:hypothetical protein
MGKLVVTEFVSLDGVMEAPGGEDFKYPGLELPVRPRRGRLVLIYGRRR